MIQPTGNDTETLIQFAFAGLGLCLALLFFQDITQNLVSPVVQPTPTQVVTMLPVTHVTAARKLT
jgi:hypothetical protein